MNLKARTLIGIEWCSNSGAMANIGTYHPVYSYRDGDEVKPPTADRRARRNRLCSSPTPLQPHL